MMTPWQPSCSARSTSWSVPWAAHTSSNASSIDSGPLSRWTISNSVSGSLNLFISRDTLSSHKGVATAMTTLMRFMPPPDLLSHLISLLDRETLEQKMNDLDSLPHVIYADVLVESMLSPHAIAEWHHLDTVLMVDSRFQTSHDPSKSGFDPSRTQCF